MPLITKASRRVKKPAWQRGVNPPLKAQRDAQAIVANHEKTFSRAFTKILRDLLTPSMLKTIDRAIRDNSSVESMLDAMPFFDPEAPETFAIWEGFALKAEKAYAAIVDESAKNEFRARGWPSKVLKVEMPEIPINPSVPDFIRLSALTRVVDMSNKERERIREILTEGLESGAHVSAMVREIKDTVGLTDFQTKQLNRRLFKFNDASRGRVAAARSRRNAGRMRPDVFERFQSKESARVSSFRARDAAKVRGQRARAIARTETNAAMAFGLQEAWRTASGAGLMPTKTKKQWASMPFEEGRSSEICQDLDGQEADVDGNFSSSVEPGFVGSGPPAHINCFPSNTLVTPCGAVAAATRRMYKGEVVVVRTADGYEFTCTPNHPILTDLGWVKAKCLNRFSRVVRYTGTKNPAPRIEAEHEHGPVMIEEIARSVSEFGRVVSTTTSARDFHDDAIDGEVCVVWADHSLPSIEKKPTIRHHGFKHIFKLRVIFSRLGFGVCSLAKFIKGYFAASHSFVGSRNLRSSLAGASPLPYGEIGGSGFGSFTGLGPSRHRGGLDRSDSSVGAENAVDRAIATPETLSNVSDALSGQIVFDDVVFVGSSEFLGHVYNLETSTGFYAVSAGGVIAHNCRSTLILVFPE